MIQLLIPPTSSVSLLISIGRWEVTTSRIFRAQSWSRNGRSRASSLFPLETSRQGRNSSPDPLQSYIFKRDLFKALQDHYNTAYIPQNFSSKPALSTEILKLSKYMPVSHQCLINKQKNTNLVTGDKRHLCVNHSHYDTETTFCVYHLYL